MTTKANMALAELAEKGADTDLLREMIQYVAQRSVAARFRASSESHAFSRLHWCAPVQWLP
jgi:hypothetical protein